MTIIMKTKVNKTVVKLVEVKGSYKVSWCGMYRAFADIDDAIKYYTEQVANFVRDDLERAIALHILKKEGK